MCIPRGLCEGVEAGALLRWHRRDLVAVGAVDKRHVESTNLSEARERVAAALDEPRRVRDVERQHRQLRADLSLQPQSLHARLVVDAAEHLAEAREVGGRRRVASAITRPQAVGQVGSCRLLLKPLEVVRAGRIGAETPPQHGRRPVARVVARTIADRRRRVRG
eukprot:1184046-Prymnesium_polylepis.2